MELVALREKAKFLGVRNFIFLKEERLIKVVEIAEWLDEVADAKDHETYQKVCDVTGLRDVIIEDLPKVPENILDVILEFKKDGKVASPATTEVTPVCEEKESTPEPSVKEKIKKEKTSKIKKDEAPDEQKPLANEPKKESTGVIGSIIDLIKEKPMTKEGLLKALVEKFPERIEAAMAKTVSVQLSGNPSRIEKEKGLKVITVGEGSSRTYSLC
jgi:hypothetical protein